MKADYQYYRGILYLIIRQLRTGVLTISIQFLVLVIYLVQILLIISPLPDAQR